MHKEILYAGIFAWLLMQAAAGGALCAENQDANDPRIAEIIQLAANDHIALLEKALANYKQNIRDYRGTFCKQERIRGKLGAEQVIAFKFKDKPFSLFMQWRENAEAADKLLYVEGANDNKMVVHATGFWSFLRSVKRDPHSKEVLESSLNPCDQFGFERIMQRTLKVYVLAKKRGELTAEYRGLVDVEGRKCAAIERILPDRPEYQAPRLTMAIDLEYLVPLSVTVMDNRGQLVGQYTFRDLRFNTGLTDKDFTPENNGL